MNKSFNTTILSALLIVLISCKSSLNTQTQSNATEQAALKKAAWLIGTWESKSSRGSLYETWSIVSDLEYLGKIYMIKDMDTVIFETVQLIQQQNNLYYIPSVKDQNNGQAVSFKSTFVSETKIIFENPEHDFPQMISYTMTPPDSLLAQISGMKEGQKQVQDFPMRKIK